MASSAPNRSTAATARRCAPWPANPPQSRPSCTACGRAASRSIIAHRSARRWRRLHLAGRDFALKRPNALSVAGWRPLFDGSRRHIDNGLAQELESELDFLRKELALDLPAA